jgi:hypothetical protein
MTVVRRTPYRNTVQNSQLRRKVTTLIIRYTCDKHRVGQNHIYTVFIRYFRQGHHQIYDDIRCIYMVLANPRQTAYPSAVHVLTHTKYMLTLEAYEAQVIR